MKKTVLWASLFGASVYASDLPKDVSMDIEYQKEQMQTEPAPLTPAQQAQMNGEFISKFLKQAGNKLSKDLNTFLLQAHDKKGSYQDRMIEE